VQRVSVAGRTAKEKKKKSNGGKGGGGPPRKKSLGGGIMPAVASRKNERKLSITALLREGLDTGEDKKEEG